MKYLFTFAVALWVTNSIAQQNKITNHVDSFAVKNALGLDISIIGRMVTLDGGVYHPDGDYLSFIIPQEKEIMGIKTNNIWYQFTKNTLTKLSLVFDADEAANILGDIMVEFDNFNAKDPITKTNYWKGKDYNIQFMLLDDKHRMLTITLAKQWPIWKEVQIKKDM